MADKKDFKAVNQSGKQLDNNRRSVQAQPQVVADARLDKIAESHFARMAKEVAELQDIIKIGVEEYEGAGVSMQPETEKVEGYAMPHEEMLGDIPQHTGGAPYANASPSERGAARGDAAALRPSGNPADWLGGAASGDASVEKDPETGRVTKTWTVESGDGTTTERTSSFNPQSGTEASTSTTTNRERDSTVYVQVVDERDGSSDGVTRVSEGGMTWSHSWARDSNGRMTHDYFETTDSSGQVVNSWDRGNDPRFRHLNRMPRDDAPTEAGARFGRRFGHEKPAPPPEVTKVNPGDPDDSGPKGPRLQPGPGIAVNPPIDAEAQQSRQMSKAQAEHWKQELLDRVGGKVNPEGGGTGVPPRG